MKKVILLVLIAILFTACIKDEEIEQFELSSEITPLEGGRISPANGKFHSGKEINLTAIPAEGFTFKNWSGALSSTENPVSVIIDLNIKINAIFEKSDKDGDGISDDVDKCPQTRNGEIVDNLGCSETQKDSDGDGVADSLDECPETPDGLSINEQGCSESQKDSDDDGVSDDSDECPDTPRGETVDVSGCCQSQKDEDHDGISDDLDLCTETPEGESVDDQGCSESQKDTDDDGIKDNIDQCPETAEGVSADENGCSNNQKDSDSDGVKDDIDECPETAEGETVDEKGCVENLTTYVPDDIFEQQLIDLGYDDVLDNYVLTANIVNVKSLYFTNEFSVYDTIVNLTGLEGFLSLDTLVLGNMTLSDDFNPSEYQNLTKLSLYGIDLNSLVIDENSNLESLDFDNSSGALIVINNNSLKNIFLEDAGNNSIFASGNSKLNIVYAFDGGLSDVSLVNNPALKTIHFETINIDNLDFSNNPVLENFRLQPLNDINFPLNFSSNSNLKNVHLGYNDKFLSINLSNNKLLERLILEIIGLESIDVSNNNLLSIFEVYDRNLTCVKVNQDQLDNTPPGWFKNPETSYSLKCSN